MSSSKTENGFLDAYVIAATSIPTITASNFTQLIDRLSGCWFFAQLFLRNRRALRIQKNRLSHFSCGGSSI
jgi:hypothetical protein